MLGASVATAASVTCATITKCPGCVTSVAAVFIKLARTAAEPYH